MLGDDFLKDARLETLENPICRLDTACMVLNRKLNHCQSLVGSDSAASRTSRHVLGPLLHTSSAAASANLVRRAISQYDARQSEPGVCTVKRILVVFVVVLLAAVLVAPVLRLRGSSMPFNVGIVKKSIVFHYYPKGKDFEVGTGFLVDIPSQEDPKRSFVAIVTARHIVDPQWEGCSWTNPQEIYARVNVKNFKVGQKEDGTDDVPLGLVNEGKNVWWASPNDRVDVAVIPVSSTHVEQLLRNDVRLIPVADFATKAETANYKIGIGDQIVTAGLVPALLDAQRNYPAFKFGRISNIPEEAINMKCTQADKALPRDVWLLAGNFVGGNSGSPVYLLPPVPSLAHRVMLIGIIAGAIPDVDLGQMVPSEYVFDVIQAHYPTANLYRGHTEHSIMK